MNRISDMLTPNRESLSQNLDNQASCSQTQPHLSMDHLLSESNNLEEEEGILDRRIEPKYCDLVQIKHIKNLNKALFSAETRFSQEFGPVKCFTISQDGGTASIGGMYGKIYFYDLKKLQGGCMDIEKSGEVKTLKFLHGGELL